ncbi:hypothetical protein BH11MYX3_BH11MYX3_41710 [soil metagenome]
MARGTTRAPSHNAYKGSIGRTQTTMVHVTGPRGDLVSAQVHTTIDAVSDPELVERLHTDDPSRALNVVRTEGNEPVRVTVPIVYHDPAAELMVLVLADAYRHTELDERIRILQRLTADEAPIPTYAKEFAVVYGSSGLRSYLEGKANDALESARTSDGSKDLDKRKAEIAAREAESDKRARDIERRGNELEAARAEVDRQRQELDRARFEIERLKSEARHRVIAAAQQVATTIEPAPLAPPPPVEAREPLADKTSIGPTPTDPDDGLTKPVALDELDEIENSLQSIGLVSAEPMPLPPPERRRGDSDVFESASTGVTDV